MSRGLFDHAAFQRRMARMVENIRAAIAQWEKCPAHVCNEQDGCEAIQHYADEARRELGLIP